MKKSIILAVTAAALVMGMAGCKGISGNADDIDSTDKRNQSTTTLTGTADGIWDSSAKTMSGTFTRFYKEFGTSENVYESTCTITLTGSDYGTKYFNSKYAAGFLFGIHTNKNKNSDGKKVYSAFCAAVRVKNGTPQYYVSHFSNYTDSELTSSTSGTLGTEDASWSQRNWTSLTAGSGYSYDAKTDVLTVPVTVKDTTDGTITVMIGGSTVTITSSDYASFGTSGKDADGNSIVDIEATQTTTKGCVIGKIASYGVIYPVPTTDTANVLNASWKISDDAVTIGALFAAPEANN